MPPPWGHYCPVTGDAHVKSCTVCSSCHAVNPNPCYDSVDLTNVADVPRALAVQTNTVQTPRTQVQGAHVRPPLPFPTSEPFRQISAAHQPGHNSRVLEPARTQRPRNSYTTTVNFHLYEKLYDAINYGFVSSKLESLRQYIHVNPLYRIL